MIDFIDERFRLFRLRVGNRLVTLSAELQKVCMSRGEPGQIIAPDSPERFDLWRRGWDKMTEGLAQCGQLDRVVVNCVFWAATGLPEFDANRDGANSNLQRMYDHCATSLPAEQFLRYDPASMVADLGHKWGLAPFHYSARLYHETLRQLKALEAERVGRL